MTNPTRQEIINAHKALSDITYLADTYLSSISGRLDETRELRQTILAALPPKPQPTMAEIEWDDDKHYLAEAESESGVKVVMLSQSRDFIMCIQPPNAGDVVIGLPQKDLTPTGRRYTPTEVQE
ncbi:MAG: hypothetical protein E6Y04_08325 [Corynebacterium sp.]|uniref:hypothetical protein n=1 Tax=Corynebacterium sp. TaxID=1720 RepID=UPI00290E5835|nr:hypothetical protein [Corynebacterium sp.]MDU4729961.1 hypothetical protein [Corynebacterium sp.]